MDIVPDARPMVIEARLSPRDAADVQVGQAAEIRLTALHERSVPLLKGVVSKLSADSFQDEHSGARYFTAEVVVPHETLARLANTTTGAGALKAGFPVDIMIPLHARTMLSYLFDPFRQSLWHSLHEQ